MEEMEKRQISFEDILAQALKIPGVRIERSKYIKMALKRKGHGEETIEKAIAGTPLQAGISLDELESIVKGAINYEAGKTSALSFAAGLPGGIAVAGTTPADLAQYLAHILRIAQKIAYLYGWDDFMEDGELSEEALDILTLFVGVMGGVQAANVAIREIAEQSAKVAAKRIAAKALTKGIVYPVVKQVAKLLGVAMTKQVFARGVSKVIPVVGGVISGGLTYATFRPMCAKLRNELALLAQ